MYQWDKTTIRARELTVGDDDAVMRLKMKLPDGAINNSGQPFAEFMIGAEVTGTPPLLMVDALEPPEVIAESYAAWLRLPRRFKRLWEKELEAVENGSPNA